MLGSALDWGQDLLYLKVWLDEHPEVGSVKLAYHGQVDPRLDGIEFTLPPEAGEDPQPGWYAVSAHVLAGSPPFIMTPEGCLKYLSQNGYKYLEHFQAVATAGYSISIYHITLEEANRVRREMRLPEVEGGKWKVERGKACVRATWRGARLFLPGAC